MNKIALNVADNHVFITQGKKLIEKIHFQAAYVVVSWS